MRRSPGFHVSSRFAHNMPTAPTPAKLQLTLCLGSSRENSGQLSPALTMPMATLISL